MAIRTYFTLGVVIAAATSGCVGISGQRFYDEHAPRARGLNEVVDCPTCPSSHGGREAVVQAAHKDEVIPPHAKFHPVPTRPVFAPKVAPATAPFAINNSSARRVDQQPEPESVADKIVDNSDAAPAPPMLQTATTKTTTRSVLLKAAKETDEASSEATSATVLAKPTLVEPQLAASTPTPAKIEHTDATPLPVAKTTKPLATATVPPASTSDGWRPRVAN